MRSLCGSLLLFMVSVGISYGKVVMGADYAMGAPNNRQEIIAIHMNADNGNPEAQYTLGSYYSKGKKGVPQDAKGAIFWYQKAADQGHEKSQYELGILYRNGKKVRQDFTQAIYWFRKAARRGHPTSQVDLGEMHYYGAGVPRNYKMAAKWYRKAAKQGSVKAQSKLAVMYFAGYGVNRDYAHAYVWANLAAARGNNKASKFRKLLRTKMSTEQLGQAATIADKYLAKYSGIFANM